MSPLKKECSQSQMVSQLKALGLRPGHLVMVHASMRAVGPLENGARGLLAAIREALGAQGTLLMVLGADSEAPFSALETEVDVEDMGVLAEVFREYPGVRVNDHAAARYGAWGPLAAELIDDPPLHDYHGPGSVLHRFTEHGGSVLRLGADPDTVTLTHWAEYLADLPHKRRVRRRYLRRDIGEQWIESLDDNDGIVDWPGGDYFPQIWIDFAREGHARTTPVGHSQADLFLASAFVSYAVKWMEHNLTSSKR